MNAPHMRIGLGATLRMSLEQVWAHKFRSGLTVLGIVIGITTVVTVASLLTGLRKGIEDFFLEFGPDNIFIAKKRGGRSIPIHPELRRALVEARRLCKGHGPLIRSERGGAMTPQSLKLGSTKSPRVADRSTAD